LHHGVRIGSISKAFETETDRFTKPDYQFVFNMIAREFAQVFCVSTEAMRIRLEKLELLLRDVPHQQILAGVG
jgi:hypothetical protein